MLYRELRDRFIKFNREHPNANPLKGFIVFSAENWPKTYSEKSRTYEVHSDNKAFRPNASSCSLFGSSLDGTDQGVRLDWYMADFGIPGGWAVERCIIEEPVTRVDFTPNDIEAVYDEIDRRIDTEIRDGDFTDEKGEIHMDAVDDCRADIQGLQDAQYIDLLHQRYVEELAFEEIAVNMTCSIRNVYNLHGQALQAFQQKYLTEM